MVMAGALKPGSSEYPRYSRVAPSLYGDDYLLELCGWSDFASFGLTPRSRLLAICAEPNLGASDVITDILLRVPLPGAKVFRRSLLGHDPDSAAAALVRLARSVSKAPSPAVVAIDDIPSSDEPDALRQANALRRMWEAGALVVFSLPPEAGQLLSFLPECSVVSSRGLLIQSVVDHGASARSKLLWRLSFGIPDLVRLLEPVPNDDLERSLPSHSYGDALSRHLSLSLRRSLTDEELRVRLCMVLLGSGAFEDLSLALDGPCDEMLSHISSVAPFFSVDHSRRSFLTLLTDEALVLPGPLARLEATSALFPDVVANSLRLILERGSFLRAVRLFALPGGSGAYGHALRFGASLLDAGGAGVVASALEERLGSCRTEDRSQALSSAVSAVCGEDVGWASLEKYRDRVIKEEGVRDALMFVDAREALRGRRPLVAYAELEWSGLGRRLLVHREAVELMAGGRPSAAMRLLLANPCGPSIETVSSALLCLDQEVARLLLCDDGGRSETLVERSVEILRSSQARGLTGYADCAMALRAALRPAGNASHIESALSRAEKSGDTVVQAVSLAAGCVYDLRSGAFPRASVRSTLAVVIARRAGLDYVARVSRLLGEAARFLMGDLSEGDAVDSSPDELGEICRFAHDVMRADRDLGSLEDEHGAKLPVDTLWLLVVLSECLGDFSGLFEKMLPASWRYAVSATRSGKEAAALRDSEEIVFRRADSHPALMGEEAPIRVSLLGGFCITVRGIRVLDGRVGHRNAQSMLVFLLLQRRATARRRQIVEQIWPECDYAIGANRVYQATSALRAAIAEVDPSLDPFVLGRSTRSIAIDKDLVSCDVDDLRACARAASDGEDDAEIVQMARRAERLYAGDLYVPSADRTGFVAAKRDELRDLYVDAMVAGSDAALRLDRKRTAARLAANALEADAVREDAVVALVSALRADGRDVEADRQCRSFVRRLAQTTGSAPSWRLRQVMRGPSEARGGGEEGFETSGAQ